MIFNKCETAECDSSSYFPSEIHWRRRVTESSLKRDTQPWVFKTWIRTFCHLWEKSGNALLSPWRNAACAKCVLLQRYTAEESARCYVITSHNYDHEPHKTYTNKARVGRSWKTWQVALKSYIFSVALRLVSAEVLTNVHQYDWSWDRW